MQHNSFIPFIIGCPSFQLFQIIPKLVFQNVLLERIFELSWLIICIHCYSHKARYKLCHLFLVFWVFWKVPMRTCVHGAQMEQFTRICDYISFLATFVGGWLDDTSSFSFKWNLHACKTTWEHHVLYPVPHKQFQLYPQHSFGQNHKITLWHYDIIIILGTMWHYHNPWNLSVFFHFLYLLSVHFQIAIKKK